MIIIETKEDVIYHNIKWKQIQATVHMQIR